jgi:4-diphosphocytidyl-2-C-methyl-D-erythritol kinase
VTDAVTVPAHAKVNVFLRVLGPRADGYHDVETILLPIDLRDDVTVTESEGLTIEILGGPSELTDGSDNLAIVAARALAESASADRPGAHVRIEKRIPVAAGMGGGSADAAATLRALNELWDCGLGTAELAEVAAAVGADVPGLLAEGAVFADGRGAHVTPVHAPTTWWVVKPFDLAVSTADAYAWWDEEPVTGPDPGALVAALETGNVELLGPSAFNDLQGPVARHHPQIERTIAAFLEAGALGAVMTGSGPTVVALARHVGHAASLVEAVPGSMAVWGPPVADNREQSGVV